MKKTLIMLGILIAFTFTSEKFLTVKFSETQLNKHWQKLNTIKAIAEASNLPHQQVSLSLYQ